MKTRRDGSGFGLRPGSQFRGRRRPGDRRPGVPKSVVCRCVSHATTFWDYRSNFGGRRPPSARRSPPLSPFRERESNAFLTATEFVLLPAITGTRRVAIGPWVRFGGRRHSRACPKRGATWRRAALRSVSRNPPVHLREHLLVSPDHGNDDGVPKVVEFLIIHLEA